MRILPSQFRAAVVAAREHVRACNGYRLPIDVKSLACQLGVVKIEPRDMRADGYLAQSADGNLMICYRSGTSQERVRFTIAHEIGHLLLAKVQGKDVTDPAFRHEGENSEEEFVVNRIAAELLMPGPLLLKQVQSASPSWTALWQLRTIFGVSTTALLRRILELPGLPSVFFRIRYFRESSALEYHCKSSEQPQVLFGRPVQEEADHVLREAKRGMSPKVQVYFGDGGTAIQLASRLMGFGDRPECWSIGWQTMNVTELGHSGH